MKKFIYFSLCLPALYALVICSSVSAQSPGQSKIWYLLKSDNTSTLDCNINSAKITITPKVQGSKSEIEEVRLGGTEIKPNPFNPNDPDINTDIQINADYKIFFEKFGTNLQMLKKTGRWGTCIKSKVQKKVYESTAIKTININKSCVNVNGSVTCSVTVSINGQTIYPSQRPHPFCRGEFNLYKEGESMPINLCKHLKTTNIQNIENDSNNTGPFKAEDVFEDDLLYLVEVGEGKYLYDDQAPKCGDKTKNQVVYNTGLVVTPSSVPNRTYPSPVGAGWTSNDYQGGWTFRDLYYRAACDDTFAPFGELSGCMNGYSEWHKADSINSSPTAQVRFVDRVGNSDNDSCKFKPMLIDKKPPNVDKPTYNTGGTDQSIPGGSAGNTTEPTATQGATNTTTSTIYMYADPITFKGTVIEEKDESGIETISLTAHKAKGDPTQGKCDFDVNMGSISTGTNPSRGSWGREGKGSESTRDTADFNFTTAVTQTEGCYQLKIEAKDYAGNKLIRIFNIAVVPNLRLRTKLQKTSTGVYANNLDSYNYAPCFEDSWGNKIHDKEFRNLSYNGTGITLPEGGSALTFPKKSFTTDAQGCGAFSVQSYMPGALYHDFTMKYKEWDTKYVSNGDEKNANIPTAPSGPDEFLKLYTSTMEFASGGILNNDPVTARLVIGAENEVLLEEKEEPAKFDEIVKSTVEIDNTNIEAPDGASYVFFGSGTDSTTKPKVCDFGVAIYKNICFYAQALRGLTAKEELNILARPIISYSFVDGTFATYQLSPTPTGLSDEPVTLSGGTLNGIYIGGQQRSNGKDGIVSNMENIGGLKGFEFTNAIRKQVALVTRNRAPNDGNMIGGILYVTGDKNLSDLLKMNGWKTVIIEDGDLTLDENYEERTNPRGIIVVTKKDQKKGNIYIKPDVTKIAAMIFADGSIESVDDTGAPFLKSDMIRTKALTKQLMIYGTILSRNTIGGAILGELGEKYVLPGSEDTDDLDAAVRYDLSFLRMYNYGSDGSTSWSADNADKEWHQGHSESTVVIPNPEFISNPPPVFNFKE
ncbi:hypothetical protein CSB09_03490 [Candidatus Gracilibacteria bacterium]|nr:MAG: hypothetical protein CSB09_03490 [Candidatus Gracilibacteria bacterium]